MIYCMTECSIDMNNSNSLKEIMQKIESYSTSRLGPIFRKVNVSGSLGEEYLGSQAVI